MKNKKILLTSFIALFAAIICIGCFMRIPLGPVPIVLQNVLCILTALLLGSFWGALPTALFLLAGLIGLPVYAGASSGIAVWLGPTGGFLGGYLLGALASGLISGRPSIEEKTWSWKVGIRVLLGLICGMIIMYVPGIWHFANWAQKLQKVPQDKSLLSYTLAACVIPYIPGDIIKMVVAYPIAIKLRPVLAQYLYEEQSDRS